MTLPRTLLIPAIASLLGLLAPGSAHAAPRFSALRNYAEVKMEHATESFEDFEKPKLDEFWHTEGAVTAKLVEAHATAGKQALQVVFHDASSRLRYRRDGLDGYGSTYSRSLELLGARFLLNDVFVFDVFNPAAGDVKLLVTFAQRSFPFTLKSGANTVSLSTEDIAAAVYRMTQATHLIAFSVEDARDTVLVFDSFRLERETIGPNMKQLAKCFSFGPADMTRPGFLSVDSKTAYDPRRGYGWLEPNLQDEKDKLTTIRSSGAEPLDDLIRGGVQNLTSVFVVNCPPGKYRVHMVGGYRWGGIFQLTPLDYDFTVEAEGQVKVSCPRVADPAERVQEFYGHDATPYEFDEDIWEKFASSVYGPVVFDVDVADGQLTLGFQTSPQVGKGLLNFMVVYPVDQAGRIEPELRRLWYNIVRRYNRVSWRPLDPALAVELKKPDLHEEYLDPKRRLEKIAVLTARPGLAGRDVLLFARDHLDQVYPDTVPATEEETTHIDAAGTPGETVPLTFDLFALEELKAVRVDVEPFEGPRLLEIPAEDIAVNVVQYSRRMLAQQQKGDWQYMVVPWYLVGFETVDVDRYMSRRFWINLHLSSDTVPGEYTSIVRITTAANREVVLKAKLDVFPFRLAKPDRCEFGAVYFVQPFDPGNEPYGLATRTLNSRQLPDGASRRIQTLFEKLHRQEIAASLAALQNCGFDTVYIGDWLKDMAKANEQLDEPLHLLDATTVQRSAKARFASEGKKDRIVYVDKENGKAYLAALNTANDEIIASLRAENLKVYLGLPATWIPIIEDPGVARFLMGVYLWRTGVDGVVVGPVRSSWGDPYNPFDGYGGEPGSLLMPSSRAWPNPNTSCILEEMHEGINDYRYLITLERHIRAAEGRQEAKLAADFLAQLRKEVSGDLSDVVEPTGAATWRIKPQTPWTADRYRRLRRDITTHILSLGKATVQAEGRDANP